MILDIDKINKSIANNSNKHKVVERLNVRTVKNYDFFPLKTMPIVSNEICALHDDDDDDDDDEQEEILPVPPTMQIIVPKIPIVVATAPTKIAKYTIDPIILGIELYDIMYSDAPYRTKHQIEIEEAQRIEKRLDNLYKSAAGRSRGWTKVGLESMLKPRCASGGDLKEIDRAKKPFLWSVLKSDKPTSAFLDFLCVAKNIRVAVWSFESKEIIIYPAADMPKLDDTDTKTYTLYNIDNNGHPILNNIYDCKHLVEFCDTNNWALIPTHSVIHSLSNLTKDDLVTLGQKLGMTHEEEETLKSMKKEQQILYVAKFKLRQRLMVV